MADEKKQNYGQIEKNFESYMKKQNYITNITFTTLTKPPVSVLVTGTKNSGKTTLIEALSLASENPAQHQTRNLLTKFSPLGLNFEEKHQQIHYYEVPSTDVQLITNNFFLFDAIFFVIGQRTALKASQRKILDFWNATERKVKIYFIYNKRDLFFCRSDARDAIIEKGVTMIKSFTNNIDVANEDHILLSAITLKNYGTARHSDVWTEFDDKQIEKLANDLFSNRQKRKIKQTNKMTLADAVKKEIQNTKWQDFYPDFWDYQILDKKFYNSINDIFDANRNRKLTYFLTSLPKFESYRQLIIFIKEMSVKIINADDAKLTLYIQTILKDCIKTFTEIEDFINFIDELSFIRDVAPKEIESQFERISKNVIESCGLCYWYKKCKILKKIFEIPIKSTLVSYYLSDNKCVLYESKNLAAFFECYNENKIWNILGTPIWNFETLIAQGISRQNLYLGSPTFNTQFEKILSKPFPGIEECIKELLLFATKQLIEIRDNKADFDKTNQNMKQNLICAILNEIANKLIKSKINLCGILDLAIICLLKHGEVYLYCLLIELVKRRVIDPTLIRLNGAKPKDSKLFYVISGWNLFDIDDIYHCDYKTGDCDNYAWIYRYFEMCQ